MKWRNKYPTWDDKVTVLTVVAIVSLVVVI